MTDYQTNLVTIVLIARIPPEGIADFRATRMPFCRYCPNITGVWSVVFAIRMAP